MNEEILDEIWKDEEDYLIILVMIICVCLFFVLGSVTHLSWEFH